MNAVVELHPNGLPARPHRPTNCSLCGGLLAALPMLGSMGCSECGSTFTLDGLVAQRRRGSTVDWNIDPTTIPDDRKDGREVLLWTGSPIVSSFDDGWRDPVGRPVQNATHWADVEGPGA